MKSRPAAAKVRRIRPGCSVSFIWSRKSSYRHAGSGRPRGGPMADVGCTTLGFAVAYLLPGLAAAMAAAFWSSPMAKIFQAVIEKQNLALGALGATLAITAGIFLTLFRA